MDDNEFRELQERSLLIIDLTNQPGWALLADRAKEDLWTKHELIMGGLAQDFEHYRTTLAWMAGAQHVLSIPSLVQEALDLELVHRQELELAEEEAA